MLRKTLITSFLSIASLVGVGLIICPIREADTIQYQNLVNTSTPDVKESILSYSQQKRKGVCKQIWYQDDTPLYFRIDSGESELFFFQKKNKIEVIEELGKVHCIMQEELYFDSDKPMQRIRYIEAEKASYNYNTNLFVAEGVKLWKYQLEGHIPPTEIVDALPLMCAIAQSVEFNLQGKKLDFIAHRMKATMNSLERSL